MTMRGPCRVVPGSESAHCCFQATVLGVAGENVCETLDTVTAYRIAAAFNGAPPRPAYWRGWEAAFWEGEYRPGLPRENPYPPA
jgi:hypothetical protein